MEEIRIVSVPEETKKYVVDQAKILGFKSYSKFIIALINDHAKANGIELPESPQWGGNRMPDS